MASLPLDKQMNVIKANIGAETENISKCFRALLRSRPSCSRKVTSNVQQAIKKDVPAVSVSRILNLNVLMVNV